MVEGAGRDEKCSQGILADLMFILNCLLLHDSSFYMIFYLINEAFDRFFFLFCDAEVLPHLRSFELYNFPRSKLNSAMDPHLHIKRLIAHNCGLDQNSTYGKLRTNGRTQIKDELHRHGTYWQISRIGKSFGILTSVWPQSSPPSPALLAANGCAGWSAASNFA